MNPNFIQIIIPILSTLMGVIAGSVLNYRNSYGLFIKQERFNKQRMSYAKLVSLKIPWVQAIQTNIEASLLSEFYETRYILFSKNPNDLLEAKKQNDRALKLISNISTEQKQVFKTLGIIQTCYKITEELQNAIDELFHYESLTVDKFPKEFKNEDELSEFFKKQNNLLQSLLRSEYKNKFDNLLEILRKQIDKK